MPMSGLTDEQLIDEFKSIIAKSTNSRSRNFLGFPDATVCPAALGVALLIPLLNQNMANPETCPPEATLVGLVNFGSADVQGKSDLKVIERATQADLFM